MTTIRALPGDADPSALQGLLRRTATGSCDYADAYVERSAQIALRYVSGRVVDSMSTRRAGSSIRRISAGGATYEATDDPGLPRLVLGADMGRALEAAEGRAHLDRLMLLTEEAARRADPRIKQVLIDAEMGVQEIAAVDTGDVRYDHRSLLYLTIRVIAEEHGRRTTGFFTPGTSQADMCIDASAAGRAAADRALTALSARPAPVSHLPVVVGPGRGMVLIHEACCHLWVPKTYATRRYS